MKTTKRSIVGVLTGLSVLVATGCTDQTSTQQPGSGEAAGNKSNTGEVNLYSSRHYDTDDELYNKFTEETGIKVNLIEAQADKLTERIKSEGANSPADVLITVDIGNLWRAQQEGILQPLESPTLESAVPENLRSSEGYWYGLSKRARIIVYNKDKVKPEELSTYEALAGPEWKGRVCVRSSNNIYNQSLVAEKINTKGVAETETWAKGLVNNFARQPEGNDVGQIKAVAEGQCDVALVNSYYIARIRSSDQPENQAVASKIGVFFPNQKEGEGGTHINISGGGVAANAPHKENAVKFLEYLITPEAQEIFANGNNEFPIVTGVEPNPTVASFGKFKESQLNIAASGEKNAEAVKLMDRAGWK
ncbi:extracellular solute-binding protein [Lyngbya aestuarii]|uniref:extracellular solute-binding protein n=1 Tax=Lyngbya aestuarii TaxID=118322 RepID=UPI00403DC9B3